MKICYSSDIFTYQKKGGISRYFIQLIERLPSKGAEIFLGKIFNFLLYRSSLKPFRTDFDDLRTIKKLWVGCLVPKLQVCYNSLVFKLPCFYFNLSIPKADIFHFTYYDAYQPRIGRKKATTCHDFIYEIYRLDQRKKVGFQRPIAAVCKQSILHSDLILCVSKHTEKDLYRLHGDLLHKKIVRVVSHGTNVLNREAPAFQHPRPYFLYVGAKGLYKNALSSVRAFAASSLAATHDYIFVGSRFNAKEQQLIENLGLTGKVITLEADDDLLASLYKGAEAFIYPSLYEGFGLPILEAFALGCPVLSSNRASLPEVGGEAALYFDPLDCVAMAEAMEKVVHDSKLRQAMIEAGYKQQQGFSWQKCADQTYAAYQDVLAVEN